MSWKNDEADRARRLCEGAAARLSTLPEKFVETAATSAVVAAVFPGWDMVLASDVGTFDPTEFVLARADAGWAVLSLPIRENTEIAQEVRYLVARAGGAFGRGHLRRPSPAVSGGGRDQVAAALPELVWANSCGLC